MEKVQRRSAYINWDIGYLWFRRHPTGHFAFTKFINNVDKCFRRNLHYPADVNSNCKRLVLKDDYIKAESESKRIEPGKVEEIIKVSVAEEAVG